jgi:hypothetical protein
MMKTIFLLTTIVGAGWLLGTCQAPATPTPPAIVDTWIDAPEDGSTIQLAPYSIVFHSASVMGMDEFEVSINGTLLASVPPKTTGSSGSQGTLFMSDYEWHPPDPGIYEIVIQPKDQNGGYGPSAQVQVTVMGAFTQAEDAPILQLTAEQLPTGLPTFELAPTPTPTLIPQGFGEPEYSTDKVYYRGLGCGSKQVDIQIQVADPAVHSVVLFVRLEGDSGEKTDWKAIPMSPLGNGYFGYELVVERELPEVFSYTSAFVQIQIVATDSSAQELGRTPVGSEVMVERCSS